MYTKCLILIGLMGVLLISAGCGKTMLERHWGDSFESVKLNQILNLEAGENLEPVVELDGRAAANALGSYYGDGSKAGASGKTYTFNIGGGE